MGNKIFDHNLDRGILIVGMPGPNGSLVDALIAAHGFSEQNIHVLDTDNVTPEQLKEYEDYRFARSNRNLDFERLAIADYTGYDVKRVKKPVNEEWKRRMMNLQNKV